MHCHPHEAITKVKLEINDSFISVAGLESSLMDSVHSAEVFQAESDVLAWIILKKADILVHIHGPVTWHVKIMTKVALCKLALCKRAATSFNTEYSVVYTSEAILSLPQFTGFRDGPTRNCCAGRN